MTYPKPNATVYLNNLLQSLAAKRGLAREYEDLTVEFIPRFGWAIVGGEPRHFGDDGRDFIGDVWRLAAEELKWRFK